MFPSGQARTPHPVLGCDSTHLTSAPSCSQPSTQAAPELRHTPAFPDTWEPPAHPQASWHSPGALSARYERTGKVMDVGGTSVVAQVQCPPQGTAGAVFPPGLSWALRCGQRMHNAQIHAAQAVPCLPGTCLPCRASPHRLRTPFWPLTASLQGRGPCLCWGAAGPPLPESAGGTELAPSFQAVVHLPGLGLSWLVISL